MKYKVLLTRIHHNWYLQHIGLVHRVANHLKARLPDHVELEELVQIGMLGLLEATKNFDSSARCRVEYFCQ